MRTEPREGRMKGGRNFKQLSLGNEGGEWHSVQRRVKNASGVISSQKTWSGSCKRIKISTEHFLRDRFASQLCKSLLPKSIYIYINIYVHIRINIWSYFVNLWLNKFVLLSDCWGFANFLHWYCYLTFKSYFWKGEFKKLLHGNTAMQGLKNSCERWNKIK